MNTSLPIINISNLQFLFELRIRELNGSLATYTDGDHASNHAVSIGQASIKNGFLVLEESGRKELGIILDRIV